MRKSLTKVLMRNCENNAKLRKRESEDTKMRKLSKRDVAFFLAWGFFWRKLINKKTALAKARIKKRNLIFDFREGRGFIVCKIYWFIAFIAFINLFMVSRIEPLVY